jgi:hypothetical protein
MPGPAPSRNPRRRNARPEWRQLPASGRAGDPPAWPLDGPSPGEAALWAELWATPQAVAWDELGWGRVVARYVRIAIEAEAAGAIAATRSECRQLEDRLGLNPMSMKRLQWELVDDATGQTADVPSIEDYRSRVARG